MKLRQILANLAERDETQKVFEANLALAKEALELCGMSHDYTVDGAIRCLVDENKSSGFTLLNDDYFIKHDLCHVFTDAVGGTPAEELPADAIEPFLFGRNSDFIRFDRVRPESFRFLEERAAIISSLYRSVFGVELADIDFASLRTIPLAVFGIEQAGSGWRTRYRLMPAEDRGRFLGVFARLCEANGRECVIEAIAIQDAPARLPTIEQSRFGELKKSTISGGPLTDFLKESSLFEIKPLKKSFITNDKFDFSFLELEIKSPFLNKDHFGFSNT